jgi:hypothetical protein
MAVYNRATGEFSTGNELGEIQTFFIPGLFEKPDGSKVNYVDNLINEGKLINLN